VQVTDGAAHVVFTEQVGPVDVAVTGVGGALGAELRLAANLIRPVIQADCEAVAAALGLPLGAVLETWYAGVGLPVGFARLASETDVDEAVLDPAAWAKAFADGESQILYFFAGDLLDGADLYARMFAPGLGVPEDPATGSAVAALVACLAERDGRPDAIVNLTVRQGFRMGRPSYVRATARTSGGRLEYVTVGGGVALFATGTIDPRTLP
jgi:trans-2,3-dihydro-3-hydroxyanthranilate isomerase